MKKYLRFTFLIAVVVSLLLPAMKSSAKETAFNFSNDTKAKYKNQTTVVISKKSDLTSWQASDVYPKVTEVRFEDGTTELNRYVFYYFPNVTKIVLPKSVSYVNYAFTPYSLDDVTKIEYRLTKLVSIQVDPENPYYTSIDGALYTKDETELICYPSANKSTKYVMPDLVTKMERFCFGSNQNLKEIRFGTRFNWSGGRACYEYGRLPKLAKYSVAEDNCYLSVDQGVLYNFDQTKLYSYPRAKQAAVYTVPEYVVDLEDGCFEYAVIDQLVLPSGVHRPNGQRPFIRNQIASVSLKDGVEMKEIDGVLYNEDVTEIELWPARKVAEEVIFPSTLTQVIDIPNSDKVKKITVPRDASYLSWMGGNNSLESIAIEEGNEKFALKDGLLYSSDFQTLYLAPSKAKITTITIPKEFSFPYYDYAVTMPSVTKIIVDGQADYFPFERFPNLKQIAAGKNNKKVKVVKDVLYSVDQKTLLFYPPQKTDKNFTIPSTVTGLGRYAFYTQNYLETLTFPKSMKFNPAESELWFVNCKKLKAFKVASGNSNLCAAGGVLFNKKKTILYCYPMAKTDKSYTIPDTVKQVYFFGPNPNLTTLTIGAKVENIYKMNYLASTAFPNLAKINLSSKNKKWVINDGALYQKEGSGLYLFAYPTKRKNSTFTIASNCTGIDYDIKWDKFPYLKTLKSASKKFMVVGKKVDYTYYD